MNIITLTTDMGLKDHYVATLKGKIYSLLPGALVVDVSHNVKPFNISQASYFLKNIIKDFPAGSIHVIGVDAEPLVNFSQPEESSLPMILLYKKQYFVGTDNGIFSLLLENNKFEALWSLDDVLSQPELMNFPTKNILIPAACKLASGESPDKFASPAKKVKRAIPLSPVIDGNILKGAVIHIDHFGNLITNIKKEDFYRIGRKAPFVIYFRQKEYYIDEISLGYNEVPSGEKVAIFNDSNLLEIAINKGTPENGGGANALFGLRLGDIIRIEFTPRGSRETLESLF
ncbi:MAG: SAM-dependent chlorinase/fluorinase [Brumimicrobium sp.]